MTKIFISFLLLITLCTAGITNRLSELGFTRIMTTRQVPKEVCGSIIEKATLVGNEWKNNSFGDRIGIIDTSCVMYLGDIWPVTGTAFADFDSTTYIAIETSRFLLLLSNVPKNEYRGRFFLIMIFKSRIIKLIIE